METSMSSGQIIQDLSELPSEDTAGFKDNSASTLNTLVKYLNLHGLTLVPQWEEKAEEHCDSQFSLPPQVQSSQFAQTGTHPLPAATQPQDTEPWMLFTSGALLKAKSQPVLFPSLCCSFWMHIQKQVFQQCWNSHSPKERFTPIPSLSCSLLGAETPH